MNPQDNTQVSDLESLDDIEARKRIRVMAKAKKGKRLSEGDRKFLAGEPNAEHAKEQRKAAAKAKRAKLEERAAFWNVRVQTIYRMQQDNLPVDSVEGMAKWFDGQTFKSQQCISPAFRERLNEERIRLGIPGVPKFGNRVGVVASPGVGSTQVTAQEEQAEFERSYVPGGTAVQENLAELMREKAFYLFRMRKARTANDPQKENEAAKSYRQFSDLVHDCELRLRKLGRDTGDLVAKSEVEFHLNFVAYHLLLCMDAATEAVVSGFKRMGPNASEHRQRQLVFEAFGPTKFFEPYYRAAEGTNAAAPPEWLINGLKAGAAAVIEENAKAGKVI